MQNVFDLTVHARGLTGAALVDEQNVPVPAHGLERVGIERVELDRALPGAAREDDDGVGLGLEVECGHHRHSQLDQRRIRVVRVLRPLERAAGRLHARERRARADPTGLEFERTGRCRGECGDRR